MTTIDLIPKSFDELKQKCEVCVQAKQPIKSFQDFVQKETCLFELIHNDICDNNGVITCGGNKYFITFIDDFSKYCYVYLIIHKSKLFDKFKVYKAEVENQSEKNIKILHSDKGGEYSSIEIGEFFESYGIIHEVTPSYAPQYNGIVERKNHTLVEPIISKRIRKDKDFGPKFYSFILSCVSNFETKDLGLVNKPIPPISMHCDSQVVIVKVTSKNFNEKRKHLRIRYKSIRNLITNGVIYVDLIGSKNNIANPLTKGLTHQQVLKSLRGMRLKSIN
uniref:Retrovirus-related Pol polyprotein from transposon TNT 1-94 n=1 Tax=Cajanus cajan TaxID=3821 RepID=A0A151STQ7_CAJCA|nr:Retrovirus-related Pol polyprotein from transposon TNT 1-94 [Cajanus cajan]